MRLRFFVGTQFLFSAQLLFLLALLCEQEFDLFTRLQVLFDICIFTVTRWWQHTCKFLYIHTYIGCCCF